MGGVWKTELDKLPADLRPYVERMLGRRGRPAVMDYVARHFRSRPGASPKLRAPRVEPAPPAKIEKRLEEMNRRLEDLRRSMEEMRAKQPPHNP